MDILALVKSVTTFVLRLSEVNTFMDERGSKQGAIGLSSPSGIKIIFVLLAEVVTVHI